MKWTDDLAWAVTKMLRRDVSFCPCVLPITYLIQLSQEYSCTHIYPCAGVCYFRIEAFGVSFLVWHSLSGICQLYVSGIR